MQTITDGGSIALTEFIHENKPLLGISGRIHELPEQPGGNWIHPFAPGCTWFQPGQTGFRLHCMDIELDDPIKFDHSIYGSPKMSISKLKPMVLKEPAKCCGVPTLLWNRDNRHYECPCGQLKVNETGRVAGKPFTFASKTIRKDV